ncbi:hypothetical protein F900_01081 [Acinetobacter modestus]|uniref:Uncharacterized protein n=1 Tax=Acinetobacter modestus TaxID=1776740 RepID=N9NKW9_9GAMM|nr:hypothetical protein [Acinetobacter modestus]ENX02635.1 hypothetical protein F900_01081 [Acinetobacter modestus]
MSKLNIVRTFTLSILIFTPSIYAETRSEMFARIAEEGRKNNKWTSEADCKAEQEVVRKFRFRGATTCDDRTGNNTEQSIAAALRAPWESRYSGKVQGALVSTSELKESVIYLYKAADEEDQKKYNIHSVSRGDQCTVALYRLTACAYQTAAMRKDSIAAVSPEVAKAKLESQCSTQSIEKANLELQKIDQRIADYLASSEGKQLANATPSLQVVMWGTSEQAKIMKKYCPDADAFKQEIADRMVSYEGALRTCRQIQSSPEVCGPVAP